ncbi:hypothetical protein WN944_002254 [Citrus x changshan-huyou]|uniref:Uncharacterized protein n=1 Tax=Citrus x changshan-huyou TaxID=2935761 RepID=A0AAP0MMH9_9ROSI
MVPPNNPVIIYLSLVWTILVFVHFDFANSRAISKHDELPQRGDCVNCHGMSPPLPPSSGSEYPLYGAPPPPASAYPSYGAPPPPDPLDQGNCPPLPPQCCRYPPPNTYIPPAPPNTYTYFPSDSILPTPFPTISLVSIMMFLASFALLF